MTEVSLVEEERRSKKKHRVRVDEQAAIETGSAPTPGSFNLHGKSNKIESDDEKYEAAPAPTAAPTIINNIGTSGQSDSAAVAPDPRFLAHFVVTGPTYMRDSRMRTACDMIHSGFKTEEERVDAANKLDAEIAKREPKDEAAGFGRTARVAFDKLKSFLK